MSLFSNSKNKDNLVVTVTLKMKTMNVDRNIELLMLFQSTKGESYIWRSNAFFDALQLFGVMEIGEKCTIILDDSKHHVTSDGSNIKKINNEHCKWIRY
jgi:hypothetical protein